MAQFMLLYTGRTPKPNELPPEQSIAMINGWKQWGQNIGNALIDSGTPFGSGVDLIDNGEQAEPLTLHGYAIIQAQDINQALTLAKSHPFLSGNEGRSSITVYELYDPATAPPAANTQAQQPIQPAIPTEQASPDSLPPPVTLPPLAPEEPVPTQDPGELTIPHETQEDEQPPTQPNPPTPGQPSI